MHAIRRSMLKTIDRTILVGLNAGKVFGFLGSGRDSIEIVGDPATPSVNFRDLAAEGWPAFSAPLPPGADFCYAAAGPLTRVALWQVLGTREQVAGDLEERRADLQFVRAGDIWKATLPNNVRVRLSRAGNNIVLVIKQSREAESISDVIRARASTPAG